MPVAAHATDENEQSEAAVVTCLLPLPVALICLEAAAPLPHGGLHAPPFPSRDPASGAMLLHQLRRVSHLLSTCLSNLIVQVYGVGCLSHRTRYSCKTLRAKEGKLS